MTLQGCEWEQKSVLSMCVGSTTFSPPIVCLLQSVCACVCLCTCTFKVFFYSWSKVYGVSTSVAGEKQLVWFFKSSRWQEKKRLSDPFPLGLLALTKVIPGDFSPQHDAILEILEAPIEISRIAFSSYPETVADGRRVQACPGGLAALLFVIIHQFSVLESHVLKTLNKR